MTMKIGLSEEELYPWIETRTDRGSPEYSYCFEADISMADLVDLEEVQRRFFAWQARLKTMLAEAKGTKR